MAQTPIKQRLTPLDALFYYFEKPVAPFNIGSTVVLDGEISFEDFKAMMESKLPLLPRYRQKVIPAPFEAGYPSWEFDPKFDINNHIFELQLDAPGTLEQLRVLSSKLQSTVLPRNKPLWEVYVVNGFEGKRTALVTKVHHLLADGISGVDLMEIIFETSPNPAPLPPKPPAPPASPKKPARLATSLVDTWLDAAEEATKNWRDFQLGLLNLTGSILRKPDPIMKSLLTNLVPVFTEPVSMMPFNKLNSGQEELAWAEFTFEDARQVRGILGGTVNDVGLTVLSGAVIHYLEEHHERLAGRALRLMVPVNVRKPDQRGELGNMISLLPVEIPLDLKDPVARFEYITKKTGEMKGTQVAEDMGIILSMVGMVPAAVLAAVGPIIDTPIPLFNVVCTNVPGPRVPLYVLGKLVTQSYPYVPTGYTVGLSVAIFSYEKKLFFGLTADAKAMPDLAKTFTPMLEQSFTELRAAVGLPAPGTAPAPLKVGKPEPVAIVPEAVVETSPVKVEEIVAPVLVPEPLPPEGVEESTEVLPPVAEVAPVEMVAPVVEQVEAIIPVEPVETPAEPVEMLAPVVEPVEVPLEVEAVAPIAESVAVEAVALVAVEPPEVETPPAPALIVEPVVAEPPAEKPKAKAKAKKPKAKAEKPEAEATQKRNYGVKNRQHEEEAEPEVKEEQPAES